MVNNPLTFQMIASKGTLNNVSKLLFITTKNLDQKIINQNILANRLNKIGNLQDLEVDLEVPRISLKINFIQKLQNFSKMKLCRMRLKITLHPMLK